VAVNVHLGYNQEDSLVMNCASLQRGMFRSEHIRSYKAEIENKESSEKRKKPEDIVNFGKTEHQG
jgi:DNA-directed RNA polymerase IV and V subunit 2